MDVALDIAAPGTLGGTTMGLGSSGSDRKGEADSDEDGLDDLYAEPRVSSGTLVGTTPMTPNEDGGILVMRSNPSVISYKSSTDGNDMNISPSLHSQQEDFDEDSDDDNDGLYGKSSRKTNGTETGHINGQETTKGNNDVDDDDDDNEMDMYSKPESTDRVTGGDM